MSTAAVRAPAADLFLNNPLINIITGYVAHLQQQNLLSKQSFHALKHQILITIGFLISLYCLIKIQILFFWLLKFIFGSIFRIISLIFWLPLTIVRFLLPRSVDYDILFPIFWLCSIISFYVSKFSHENICRFYDQYLVRRYPIFNYDQTKRDDIRRYLFIITFIILLLLQSLFILLPIALSIRHHHQQQQNSKLSMTIVTTVAPVTIKTTTTVKSPTAKSAVKDAVETMSGNLFNRFVDAFKDDNEQKTDQKRSPIISDEKLENTFKTLQKSIKSGIKTLKTTETEDEEKKSSRFQRWIVHYIKAPFQKWEKKTNDEQINSNTKDDEEEEKDAELNSSSDTDEAEDDDDDDDDDENEEEEDDDDSVETDVDDDDDQEEHTTVTEKIRQRFETVKEFGKTIKDKITSSKDENEDEEDDSNEKLSSSIDEDEDEDEDESDDEEQSTTDKIKERITKPLEKVQDMAKNVGNRLRNKLSSSTDHDDDDEDDDEEEEESGYESHEEEEDEEDEEKSSKLSEKIRERISQPIEKVKNLASNIKNKFSSSTDEEDEESTTITEKIKEQLAKPVETVKTLGDKVVTNVKNKIASSTDKKHEESTPITDKIKEQLSKPIETAKDIGDQVLTNVKNKLSSSLHINEEDAKIETDKEEEYSSILDRVKANIFKPFEDAAANIRDKLPSFTKNTKEEDLSLLDRTKQKAEEVLTPIKDKVAENVDELKHKAENLVDSTEKLASNLVETSSKFVKEKTKQIKKSLPQTKKIKKKVKREIVKPLEKKAAQMKKVLNTKTEQLKTSVVNRMKSLTKKKKPKTLTEKAKDKFQSLSKTLQEKLPGQKKQKNKKKFEKALHLIDEIQSKIKLNGWIDEAWHIWHLTKTNLAHIFLPSTKHARHLPRYNTTSLYTAYTDLKCYDYTKINRYRSSKRRYSSFIDSYRHHSPFPVYLSVLKSNGPRCYRQYPDSACGLILKSSAKSFKIQLYRFIRFWAIIGVIVGILAVIYKIFLAQNQKKPSSSNQPRGDSDKSVNRKQQVTTSSSNRNDTTKSTTTTTTTTATTQRPASIHQQRMTPNINTGPLNEQIEKQLRLWLEHEKNDGFRNLSETCRIAINNTFLKQLEQLSVETLQFANAKIHNVSQTNNNNNNRNNETPPDKIIINAVLDIDHLILHVVNTFKEKHFSIETQKLSGQLYVLLTINPNQYSIEANLQQIQINPVNIIDPNNALSTDEKRSVVKLLDETINRTIVRCSFRLSDNQENTNSNNLYNSSSGSYLDTVKPYSSSNQLSTSSIQSNAARSRQATPNKYQPSEPLPTVLINDTQQNLFINQSALERDQKKLLVRVVKAVKLHDVEQPYCILELNHPKQIHQTSIAKNGLNPFWDERFLFECDDKSNQIHLQIIDRRKPNKKLGNDYVDNIYADVLIPFSYITSTVYKQDVQISPQYPESIIRLEFSTLSEEEALAANNGYDVESLTDSQTWPYNDREANKIEQEYAQRFQQIQNNDFGTTSYDTNTLPKTYGLSTSLYDDDRDYASTLPRSTDHRSNASSFSPSSPLTPRDGGLGDAKPQKSKSFMSSLKHLTIPRRKHHKDKHDTSMSSQSSSISQLNTSLQLPPTNTVSHSLSTALPGTYTGEYFLSNTNDVKPIRRTRSISRSFKNLFRSNSKKKLNAAKTDALGEFENVDNRNYLSTSTPTTKKHSFFHRRKSKQQTNFSTNSLSSHDYSRVESVRDTPVRANVGHPVTMTNTAVR